MQSYLLGFEFCLIKKTKKQPKARDAPITYLVIHCPQREINARTKVTIYNL